MPQEAILRRHRPSICLSRERLIGRCGSQFLSRFLVFPSFTVKTKCEVWNFRSQSRGVFTERTHLPQLCRREKQYDSSVKLTRSVTVFNWFRLPFADYSVTELCQQFFPGGTATRGSLTEESYCFYRLHVG